MSIKNIIYDAVTNSLKLLSRRTDQPSVVIPLTPGQLMPVGSIIQSIMTEAEFQAEAGTSWILMDGRSIVGSKLARIKSISVIPDASGRFLRTAGGNAAALAAPQADDNKPHTHAIDHDHPVKTSSTQSANHTHGGTTYDTTNGITRGGTTLGNAGTIVASLSYAEHSHSFTTGTESANHSHTVDLDPLTGSSGSTGTTETRPVNLTVNTFIRIN